MRHFSISLFAYRATLTAGLLLLSATATASQSIRVCSLDGQCGQVQAVDESQLDSVAGRFTIAGEVVGMSLEMTSAWQTANGQRLEGKAMLSVALPGSGHAHARIGTRTSVSDPQDTLPIGNGGTVSGGNGLNTIEGVSQIIQVAGDGNGAANKALVTVGVTPSMNAATGPASSASVASNGARAEAAVAGNAVTVQLHIPGAGVVQQRFNAGGSGNIQQAIQFAANRQQVTNQLQLQLQTQALPRAAIASAGLGHALDMLRGK